MNTQLIAKILPTKKNGKRSIGTGYLIAKDLIVTARHVVVFAERDNDIQITIECPDLKDTHGDPFTSKVTEIVFGEGDDYDIAILKCNPVPQIDISLVQLAQHFPVAHEQWSGFGYPQIGKNEETGARKKVSVLGKFHPPDKANHEINLTSESDALEKEGWCGLSGAPVFHGDTLYAVISATPRSRDECFTAVLIPWLLKKRGWTVSATNNYMLCFSH